jgi:hypothetical protein
MRTLSILKIRTAVFVSTLTLAVVSTAMVAQKPAPRSRINVPFAFQIGSTRLSAGSYVVSNPEEFILLLQDGTHSTLAMSSHELSNTPAKASKVVFHRYGSEYFLREVWLKGRSEYLTCSESKAEREAKLTQPKDQQASVQPAKANVEVAGLESGR